MSIPFIPCGVQLGNLTTSYFKTSQYGFALPSEWIRPVGEETANMVEYLASFIIKNKSMFYILRSISSVILLACFSGSE